VSGHNLPVVLRHGHGHDLSGPVRKGERAAATFSARASSSAKVRDSPV
jgi:hypothetical protein